MKQFIIHTRPIAGISDDDMSIVEVEGERIIALEDPSIMWLPKDEFRFRIFKPEFLYEPSEIKKPDGAKIKVMVPTIYCSHAIYFSFADAKIASEKLVRKSFEFSKIKYKIDFTEEEVQAKISTIKTIMLK